jgi:hypothetical protein|tara:strand:+ start:9392 stop:9649 length:258 start_codon:yes stop_codon:yes gene_type:complete
MVDNNGIADLTIKAIENKSIATSIGGTTSALAWFDISTTATIAGLCLTAVCIYAQVRLIRESEKKAKREAFEFAQRNPNAPEDLL